MIPAVDLAALGHAVVSASWLVAVLGLVTAAVLVPLRRLPPSWKAWIWWLVALRATVELIGVPALEWRVLPATEAIAPSVDQAPPSIAPVLTGSVDDSAATRRRPSPQVAASSRGAIDPWWLIGLGYIAGLVLVTGVASFRVYRLRSMLRRATPWNDEQARALLERIRTASPGAEIGVSISNEIWSPMVVGFLAPRIVLPAGTRLAASELELILAHEVEHLARRDSWRAIVPALARHLFFFHPVVRLVEREFVLAVEAACDQAVLRARKESAERYGRLLVRFACAPAIQAVPVHVWPLAASSVSRRLEMLLFKKIDRRLLVLVAPVLLLVTSLIAVPVRLVAAVQEDPPAPPSEPAPTAPPAPGSQVAPVVPTAPAARIAPTAPTLPSGPAPPTSGIAASPPPLLAPLAPSPPMAPMAPMTPMTPMPPLAPLPAIDLGAEVEGLDWLIMIDGDSSWYWNSPQSARAKARTLAAGNGGRILLVNRDGKSFASRDAEVIESVHGWIERGHEEMIDQQREVMERALVMREQAIEQSARSRQELLEQKGALEVRNQIEPGRVERLARLEADRLRRLLDEVAALEQPLADDLKPSLERASETLAELAQQLEALQARERQERLAEREQRREQFDRQRAELKAQLDQMTAERDEQRKVLLERRRAQDQEIGRKLEQLLDEGKLEPIDIR